VCTVSGVTVTLLSAGHAPFRPLRPQCDVRGRHSVVQSFIVGAAATVNSVVNAASYLVTALAPDAYTAVFGTNFSGTSAQANPSMLPAMLAGAAINITDSHGLTLTSPLYYVSPTQINFVVPQGSRPETLC